MGRFNLWVLLGLALLAVSNFDAYVKADDVTPSVDQCRPYIEKAINELKTGESVQIDSDRTESDEPASVQESVEIVEEVTPVEAEPQDDSDDDDDESVEPVEADVTVEQESIEGGEQEQQTEENVTVEAEEASEESPEQTEEAETTETAETQEEAVDDNNTDEEGDSQEQTAESDVEAGAEIVDNGDSEEATPEAAQQSSDETAEEEKQDDDSVEDTEEKKDDSEEVTEEKPAEESIEGDDNYESAEDEVKPAESVEETEEKNNEESVEETTEQPVESEEDNKTDEAVDDDDNKSDEEEEEEEEAADDNKTDEDKSGENAEAADESNENDEDSKEEEEEEAPTEPEAEQDESDEAADDTQSEEAVTAEAATVEETTEQESNEEEEQQELVEPAAEESTEQAAADDGDSTEEQEVESEEKVRSKRSLPDEAQSDDTEEEKSEEVAADQDEESTEEENTESKADEEESEERPIEDLTLEFEIPKNLRDRSHIADLLGLDEKSSIKESALKKTGDVVLKELKGIYDRAIKPLEGLYKYRDLSNRHFGDPEIFSKPLVLFMGPWSGGKSTILNYLTGNEYTPNSIRSGAEPSPAYFNLMMYGEEPEVLDGTQLAADWTFAGLQKFGQGLNDRLRGLRLPNKLLERVNIVEIPGILEVRKQVSRYFPFNDACQWFIDRADIIFLVYDPSKLDVGPETEAILDQLKGREYQTRILLNKADQVKPEELLRVQSALIWNISPLMSSAQPPVMYTVSLWSHPYEAGAPVRLLQAQERAFLTDLREAIDKRIENKIASARRFAVRIRNHAKMVDCYLTTYYNQKTLFSNKKQVADNIIEHPQNFNIYEGLSTLTNISRYDLPDPEVYMDFFKLNPLYNFKRLSETCTYFRGCPITKLDIAIAYDLPELVGKYKKLMETNLLAFRKEFEENCNTSEPEPTPKILSAR